MEKIYSWLKHNWELKLVSLFIAVLLWFYVTVLQTPQVTKVFVVPIRWYGLGSELLIEKKIEYAGIYLKGPKNLIDRLKPEELNVFLDLSKINKPGKYNVPVDVSVQRGINLMKVEPPTIDIEVYKAVIKFFLLKPTILGREIKDYKVDFTPNLIKIKGKKEDVNNIRYVTVFLTDDLLKKYEKKDRFLKIMKVYPITSEGEISENVKLEPKIVEVVFKKE